MKLIIGLGNPEARYDNTRHNAGYYMLDSFAATSGVTFKHADKFKGSVTEVHRGDEKILLLKPATYYNDSGLAARLVMDFYKLTSEDILIVHDELALPFGTVRTRQGGSDAGNNGIKSLNQHVGTDTYRIRIGVWNELRDQIDDAQFVLSKFTKSESETLKTLAPKVHDMIDSFIAGTFVTTTI